MSTEQALPVEQSTDSNAIAADNFYKVDEPAKEAPATVVKPEGEPAITKTIAEGEIPEGKKPEEVAKPKEEGKEPVVEFKVVEPENFILNKTMLDEVVSFAKENKLDAGTAQKILERENNLATSILNAQEDQRMKEVTQWIDDSKADKEIGGESFKESAEYSRRALKSFGSEGMTELLNKSGYGNHPEVVRLLSRIGKAMGDDKLIKGSGSTVTTEKSTADLFYEPTT